MSLNPNASKYDYLLKSNEGFMRNTALSFGNRRITYEEMHDRIQKYARILYNKGVRRGDVIGVCALNTPESVYLFYALDILGATAVGFDPLNNRENTKRDIELTRPKMIITVDMKYSNFKDYEKALNFSAILYSPVESVDNLKIRLGYQAKQIMNGNFKFNRQSYLSRHILKDNAEMEMDIPKFEAGRISDIMFTGGSTGTHKGVELSAEGLNSVIEGMRYIYDPDYFTGRTYLGNIPFGHMVFGRVIMHIALTNNMNFALTLKALPEDFYAELVRTRANFAVGGPPHWATLIKKKDGEFVIRECVKKNSLHHLILATSGGEALKKSMEQAINEALTYAGSTAILGDSLGATEAWSVIFLNSGNYYRYGTVGVPISTLKIKLVNPETGEEVAKGEKGLLHVSGTSVMLGYHGEKEETENVLSYDENGEKWCNLGDYLIQRDDGVYEYVGRLKRNFVCGIENIYPEQLEELLSAFSEVREAVVTAVPDDELQYIPIYHISLYDENVNRAILEKGIRRTVENKLGKSWLPYYIDYSVSPLKRMDNTKIDVSYYKRRGMEWAGNCRHTYSER